MADAMAASSGGVDWTSILKPFLSANYETSNRSELLELCSAIIKSESEILRHKDTSKNFFNSFAVLASDYISNNINGLSVSQLEPVCAACKVLLRYFLSGLQVSASDPGWNTVNTERNLNAVRTLCIGTGLLSSSEFSKLVDVMKGENHPSHNNPPPTGEKESSNKQESSKSRSDLSVSIFEQLTLPLKDGHTTTLNQGASTSSATAENPQTSTDPSTELRAIFLRVNTENLQSLRGADTLIDLCLSLPSIKRAKSKVDDALAGKAFSIPTSQTEAMAFRNGLTSTVQEINLAGSALNLPVLEPLTPSKLDKLCSFSLAILYLASSHAAASAVLSAPGQTASPKCAANAANQAAATGGQTTSLKEDDFESNATSIVEEALNLYNYLGKVIKESTRAGGHVYQNYLLAGAWVLVLGLQAHLTGSGIPASSNTEKITSTSREGTNGGRSPCRAGSGSGGRDAGQRSGLQKFQQSFGVLSVALATKMLNLFTELFEDLHLEVCGSQTSIVQIEAAPVAIMGQFTSLQRVARILTAAPVNHLLFYLAIVSYRKACSLKRLNPPDGDTFSQSDSTTYYEDMIMCSDEGSTDEDDDSEPILGQWFEATLAPPESSNSKTNSSSEHEEPKAEKTSTSVQSVIPEKGDATGYITLSTNIFTFLNIHFICSRSGYVARYVKTGLTENQMIILSAIVRDLDRDTSRSDLSGSYVAAPLVQLYCEFSGALTRFTHNLITNSNLSNLQPCLLNHLGVSPWNNDVPHAWPLQVYPRTLGILAQVLLLRPQNEKEASVISIWHRLVNTLIENVLTPPPAPTTESDNEDLNVEHAQVLLYLFHSLNLMQKKSVLLLLAGGVLRCSEVARGSLRDIQLLHLSRLLLLFDYIMKHLYDAPKILLDQIQWHLFFVTRLNNPDKDTDHALRAYLNWCDVEGAYRKLLGSVDDFYMKPRFYILTYTEESNPDMPKLDGLACNFVLGTPDKLRYPLLIDALIEILNVTNVTSGPQAYKMTPLGQCAAQYCFSVCWKLLLLLPPSASYMERLASGEHISAGPLLLYSLIWGPRTAQKHYSRWLKDCLVKQGMYTQNTDKLLKAVSDTVNNIKYDLINAKNCIHALTPEVIRKGIIFKENLPPLWHVFLIDALLAKVQISIEEQENSPDASEVINVQDLLPVVLKLAQHILHCNRWGLIHWAVDQGDSTEKMTLQDFEGLQEVLAITSSKNSLTNTFAQSLTALLPDCITAVLSQWNEYVSQDLAPNPYKKDVLHSESFILSIVDLHIGTVSSRSPFSMNYSLKRFLQCLVLFICEHAPRTENTDTKNKAIELLVAITLDSRTEHLLDFVTKPLEKMIGDSETDEHQKRVYWRVLDHTYRLILNCTVPNRGQYATHINEKILHNCLKFYERIIEKSSGRQALEAFFTGDKDLVKVLMSVSSPQMSQQYSTRVLHFFKKLFNAAEKSTTDPSLNYLCSSMSKLANVESDKLFTWLRQLILGSNIMQLPVTTVTLNKGETFDSASGKWTITAIENKDPSTSAPAEATSASSEDQKALIQENSQLLQALTSFIVKQNSNVSEEVSITILKALIQLGSYLLTSLDGTGFSELMVVMTILANAGSGKGHIHLFPAAGKWIALCAKRSSLKEILDKVATEPESIKSDPLLEAASSVMEYISDALCVVSNVFHSNVPRPFSPPWESESPLDPDQAEWKEEGATTGGAEEEGGDSGEDSDEDALCNQLCTFTVTQKEFMNQHWYHCHTCRMLDGVGVCSVCARVCHRGHDVTYAKYGNFFCDCGAKEDLSCQALFKRSPHNNHHIDANAPAASSSGQGPSVYGVDSLTGLLRRTSSPCPTDKSYTKEKPSGHIVKQLEGAREFIINFLCQSMVTGSLIEFLEMLIPSIEETCQQNSPIGSHFRGIKALENLYSKQKKYIYSDQLMVPTLGSQEGAFENVRMSYAGDQGQQIRQLLNAHFVRRVAMCCMTSTQGRRQHLAVSHEKGKITVLQLSALLKQADSTTRKLTLTRLASAPIPFTVLSLSSNLCNEDYLAVCGLKDCHVLTFTSAGAVSNHLVLHNNLEIGNFIVKAIWLPGSQTKLALVTADFVKIYDLGFDSMNPIHYFLVPSGKIRDCTFMYESGIYHILLMSSSGYIYTEVCSEESSTKYGTFYVTNTLEVHLDGVDVNGSIAGGGVSIYYSHTLGLLFYSYAQGKSFISPIIPRDNCVLTVFPINLPTPNGSGKGNGTPRNSTVQPLCQWTEIPNHPGLICAAMQSSNNPVILMLKPDAIVIQEIKVLPAKSKIMDMVAIRHSSGNDLRTTLILLCEDGSLKMYMANMEQTGYWMSSTIQAVIPHSSLKPKKKKVVKSGKATNAVFPVDFFEHCTVMNDIEWGGNDLLQIYNHAQLKHRLHTTGLFVTCNKPLGFTVEVTNNDPNMVMTGLRIQIGNEDLQRVPAFVEIFGRIIPFTPTRCRWYDIAFTREESLQADKKLIILFGPSQDSETVTIVDSIKVYGKTKDVFGWPEESDENASTSNGGLSQATTSNGDGDQNVEGGTQLTKIEKLVVSILESLDASFTLYSSDDKLASFKPSTNKVATKLLTLPTPPSIQVYSKALLASLHSTRQQYHCYKDQALLQHVLASLNSITNAEVIDLDPESYYRLVLIVRGIAVSRPQNLVKFADSHTSIQDVVLEDPIDYKPITANEIKERKRKDKDYTYPKNQHLLLLLIDALWLLHSTSPEILSLAPVVLQGLKHTEQVIHALVEIVHAFNSCDSYSNITISVYLQLLLCEDPVIAHSAKQALCKVLKPKTKRRRVYIPSPPQSHTPPSLSRTQEPIEKPSTSMQEEERQSRHYDVDSVESIALLDNPNQEGVNMNPLEALLGGSVVGFPPLLDIPPDADDETMVELAIALSLQASEQEMDRDPNHSAAVAAAAALHNMHAQYGSAVSMGSSSSIGGVSDLQLNRMPSSSNSSVIQTVHLNENAGNMSDTTASAAGSDDEGSTAATDGSTLRTSPAEQGGSAGSESGGSGVESITGEHNASGRSSAYGDTVQDNIMVSVMRHDTTSSTNLMGAGNSTTVMSANIEDGAIDDSDQGSSRLPALRIQLLERLAEYLPRLKFIEGTRTIPFLQVVLQLTADLDGHSERDRACLNTLLNAIIGELQLDQELGADICERTKQREIRLILMRLLSVFMQRCKSTSSTSSTTKVPTNDNSNFVCRTTATALHKAEIIPYCNKVLQLLLKFWRSSSDEDLSTAPPSNLLKEQMIQSPPDMTPFFQRQFVKDNQDVFQTYPQLLTEIVLRLPYQVHRHAEVSESIDTAFDHSWYNLLCDYMMTPQTPFVRRQVRKLLMFICGNKEAYRQLRDQHGLRNHMKGAKECCIKGGYQPSEDIQFALSLPYDSLVELMEHLKFCVEVAQSRTGNWQRFCIKEEDIIQFLIRVSFILDEGVAPTILQLLQCALVVNTTAKKSDSKSSTTRKDREKSDDSTIESLFEESSCVTLVEQINKQISREVLARFIKTFMLETNTTSVRWQAHALVQSIYRNSKPCEQESILELLWQLWPLLSSYGKKAAQFVDLLGYFSYKFIEKPEAEASYLPAYVERAVSVLRAQNEMLSNHPNANLYAHMGQFIELDGFYLESEPCLVCNNPEVPFTIMKLSSLKVDSKFTTTTQIVKLFSSHTISKITVRIGDLKRTKMVRTINIYYNNRSVQAVVELKNKPALWHKAKKVTLASGQTEVKIEFPLPIVACNLMIEYGDFYENIQASSETLQCPRCSASVPANPGVCANCGENVFQCHKCRAINYDEKDPFLCHACGFCKYAKFDFSLLARPCCAIESIESDEDRKKTVSNINTLLEKADRVYKQIIANKPTLEMLVVKITEHRYEKRDDGPSAPTHPNSMAAAQGKINKTIQMLAQQYCNECKTSFEELSKIVQKVVVSRKELLNYDRKNSDTEKPRYTPILSETPPENIPCRVSRCYGCSMAAIEHCLTLLKALAHHTVSRQLLCSKGLVPELVWNNLRSGGIHNQEEIRQLLCILTKDNIEATDQLCNLLMSRITLTFTGHINSSDLGYSVRHEIALLAFMVQTEDACWELKLRYMVKLFVQACKNTKSPIVMDSVILPCLKIFHVLMKGYETPKTKTKEPDKAPIGSSSAAITASNKILTPGRSLDIHKFVDNDPSHSFVAWSKRNPSVTLLSAPSFTDKKITREYYLTQKYMRKWRLFRNRKFTANNLSLSVKSWIRAVIFNPCSRLARQVMCSILENMCIVFERKLEVLKLLTHFLLELNEAGESASEFLTLYQSLIADSPYKQYLTNQGVLMILGQLMTKEIEQLHKLEEISFASDLAQGFALNQLTEILASFLEDVTIKRNFKSKLVGAVLNGYLSLRRLVVQRTRLIDETQEKLLELLEDMTTGNEEETEAFMEVCIKTVEEYSLQDILTPVFIFERLCSLIYPEENDVGEFFLTLEKDPQQEDFLQGRMLGNPYSSLEAGMGPLMRDVKNKICQDCELVALLEDDNGMELLVNNKIMSLDLPVVEVYKKVWLAEGGDHEAMRVIYRMRGLLGDATEEFVETLTNKSQSAVDNEEVYKMANVLADCGGLQIMVTRLDAIQSIIRARPLLQVLLKLFRLCVKVSRCQEVLIKPELGAMGVFLKTLKLCLFLEFDSSQSNVTEQLLDIIETVFSKASNLSLENYLEFARTAGSPEYVKTLLTCMLQSTTKYSNGVLVHLTKVMAGLTYAHEDNMKILLDHFMPVLHFDQYDEGHTQEDQQKLEMFCILTNGIERNVVGSTLKDYIINLNIVQESLDYIKKHAPCVKPTLLRTDSDELKDFISKPALKYILRFLTGLAYNHELTQLRVASAETIPIIHRLEQVSSDEHVGSLAENLLEALCTNPEVAKLIDSVRNFTRSEKKRLAMAMREKQLGQLGMSTNEKGQVTAKSAILQQIEELGEESGLVCCICREGYKYQPNKVLGVYTFTKRCNVEEFETKPRKTVGYTTVSHFNIVHIDCHMSAVRLARARDEWESAALQNANTRCNGLLPLWGPQVPESAFASCLARHNTYLQESTNHRDIGHTSTVHDMKLLLLRFAQEKSFHEDTGGGGPQSNMHMIPYLIHVGLYVINTTRIASREDANMLQYLENNNPEKWVESAYEAEGPLFWATMSLLLHSRSRWETFRVLHLRRILVLAHVRRVMPSGPGPSKSITDRTIKDFPIYRPYCVFFGLINGIYECFFKNITGSDEQWPTNLADYIRHNDEALLKATEKLMSIYTDELLPCASFSEFCDVTGLLDEITDPEVYMSEILNGLL